LQLILPRLTRHVKQRSRLLLTDFLFSALLPIKPNIFRHLANARDLENPKVRSQPSRECPAFIHLRDASYYQTGQKPNLGDIGGYTRIPLNAVIGFSFGNELT
jgi:hypothetical protein